MHKCKNCEHKLEYCKHCDIVYCDKCGEEWVKKMTSSLTFAGGSTTLNPNWQYYNSMSNVVLCDHTNSTKGVIND